MNYRNLHLICQSSISPFSDEEEIVHDAIFQQHAEDPLPHHAVEIVHHFHYFVEHPLLYHVLKFFLINSL